MFVMRSVYEKIERDMMKGALLVVVGIDTSTIVSITGRANTMMPSSILTIGLSTHFKPVVRLHGQHAYPKCYLHTMLPPALASAPSPMGSGI